LFIDFVEDCRLNGLLNPLSYFLRAVGTYPISSSRIS